MQLETKCPPSHEFNNLLSRLGQMVSHLMELETICFTIFYLNHTKLPVRMHVSYTACDVIICNGHHF